MTTPIRRTSARLALTGAMALGSAGLLAGPALAQYPPIQITIVTPGADITVEGGDWGPQTTVTITKVDRDGNAAGSASDGSTTTQAITVDVAEDGTFEAPVTVPEDAEPGSQLRYVISGVDEQGNERTEERVLEVQFTSAEKDAEADDDTELAAPLPADDGDSTALVLVSAAGVAAVAGGAAFARRRSNSVDS